MYLTGKEGKNLEQLLRTTTLYQNSVSNHHAISENWIMSIFDVNISRIQHTSLDTNFDIIQHA